MHNDFNRPSPIIEILTSLENGDILHTTRDGINYLFVGISNCGHIIYTIGNEQKYLPILTVNKALEEFNSNKFIDANWYKKFNKPEYETRPCNLSVLKNLIKRI